MSSVSSSQGSACRLPTSSSTVTSSSSRSSRSPRSTASSRASCSARSSASAARPASSGASVASGRGKNARAGLDGLVAELYRRAAISFPDEDVLVAGRVAHPAATRCSAVLDDVCPRPKYTPNGEERAWGRRLARRFGCDARYDDRSFRVTAHGAPELVLDASAGEGGRQGRGRAGRRGRPGQRRGDDRLRLGDGRGARRRLATPRS